MDNDHRDDTISPEPVDWRRRGLILGGLGAAGAAAGLGVTAAKRILPESEDPAALAPGVPDEAVIPGMRRIFLDDFDDAATIDVLTGGDASPLWFTDLPFGWGKVPAEDLAVQDSILCITAGQQQNWSIATLSPQAQGRSFGRGYYEARMRFEPRDNDKGWPAFWSLTADHITDPELRQWMEIDFFEAMDVHRPARFHGTIHQWSSDKSLPARHSDPNWSPIAPDFSRWNDYGCLWESGRVRWFLNRRQVLQVTFGRNPGEGKGAQPAGDFEIIDATDARVAVILGGGTDWPLEVDWVSVWE